MSGFWRMSNLAFLIWTSGCSSFFLGADFDLSEAVFEAVDEVFCFLAAGVDEADAAGRAEDHVQFQVGVRGRLPPRRAQR